LAANTLNLAHVRAITAIMVVAGQEAAKTISQPVTRMTKATRNLRILKQRVTGQTMRMNSQSVNVADGVAADVVKNVAMKMAQM